MPKWYQRTLPCQTGLSRATTHLENARNSKDGERAKKYCDKAKESLERIKTISTTSPLDLDQVIAKYRELGAVLEKWQYGDEAQLSYSKANELRYEPRGVFNAKGQRGRACILCSTLTHISLSNHSVDCRSRCSDPSPISSSRGHSHGLLQRLLSSLRFPLWHPPSRVLGHHLSSRQRHRSSG